jgi:DNA damage-binding protein 2
VKPRDHESAMTLLLVHLCEAEASSRDRKSAPQVTERTTFQGIHQYQINMIKFIPGRDSMSLLSACCLGHTCLTDIETGMHYTVANLNPQGWIEGVSTEKNWTMMCSVGVQRNETNVAWCGDSRGKVRCLDLRSKDVDFARPIHGSGKVTSIDFHPQDANLMLTAGNDHHARLFDIRMLRPSGAR